MRVMAFQMTGNSGDCSNVCLGVHIKAPRHWRFVRGIHRWPVDSPHKGPVTRKIFPFHDVMVAIPYTLPHAVGPVYQLLKSPVSPKFVQPYIQRKYQSSASLALCEGNPLVTGGFRSQRTSNSEIFPFHDIMMPNTLPYAVGPVYQWLQSQQTYRVLPPAPRLC